MDAAHPTLDALEPLLDIDDLAAYLGVPKQTIYDWRVNAKGPRAYRIGKHLRFTVSDVRAWMEQQRDLVGPPAGRGAG